MSAFLLALHTFYVDYSAITDLKTMSEPPMSESPDRKTRPQQQRTSLEGYLEYAVSISPETSRDSTEPPSYHGDETIAHDPGGMAQPTTEQVDQTDQESKILLNLPPWRKRALFACSCVLPFLLQFDMAAVAVTIPVSRRRDPRTPRGPSQQPVGEKAKESDG